MRDADFPDRFWFSGRFRDDALEQEYWLNVRPVAFRLAALAAFLAGITWLTSVTHELQIQDRQQGVRLLIAWRVSFFMFCLIVVGALLSEATRAPKPWVRWLLVGWYAFYVSLVAAVNLFYLNYETTPEGLSARFLAISFWMAMSYALIGMLNYHLFQASVAFSVICIAWYLALLFFFQPGEARVYVITLTTMIPAAIAMYVSMRLSGRVSRRNFYLNKVYLEAKDEAEKANSVLSLLLTSTGHDVRQPLFALDLNATVLSRALERGDLSAAQETADKQKSLTRNISQFLTLVLELSRTERNLPDWNRSSPVAVADLFETTTALARETISVNEVQWREVSSALHVEASKSMVERILLNLIINAVAHAEAERILLGVRRCGEDVMLCVVDNGRGLASEPVVFDSETYFEHRIHSEDRASGYGLDLIFRLAQNCNYRLVVRSEPGRGVHACLRLPRTNTSA